jgi:rubredoxin
MRTDEPDVSSQWCPDCGHELALTGLLPAGIGQFFCETCRYRHDRYVGVHDASASPGTPSPPPTLRETPRRL